MIKICHQAREESGRKTPYNSKLSISQGRQTVRPLKNKGCFVQNSTTSTGALYLRPALLQENKEFLV